MTDKPPYNKTNNSAPHNTDADLPDLDADLPDHLDTDDAFTREPDSRTTEVARPDVPAPATPAAGSASHLQQIAAAALRGLGFELLEVQLQNPGRRPIVVVRMDRLDEQPVTVEDLSAASRAVGAEYDRLDPVKGEYRLELESPGAKRPLLRERHFARMVGLKAKVRAQDQNFTAPIVSTTPETVTFQTADGPLTLRLGEFQANLAEFPSEHR